MLRVAAFVAALWISGSVPPDVSLATLSACERHGVDCVSLGAYLISEHGDDWTDEPEACSSRGACGPFQLAATWPIEYGYRLDDRADPWCAADMAARLVIYSQDRARKGVDWRAHLKCAPGHRRDCGWPVRSWLRREQDLCDLAGNFLRECS